MATTYYGTVNSNMYAYKSVTFSGRVGVTISDSHSSGSTTCTLAITARGSGTRATTGSITVYAGYKNSSSAVNMLLTGETIGGYSSRSLTIKTANTYYAVTNSRTITSSCSPTSATGSYDQDTTIDVTIPTVYFITAQTSSGTPNTTAEFTSQTVSYTIPKLSVTVSLNKNTPPGMTASDITLPSWTSTRYKNNSITEPGTPTWTSSDYIFTGWYTNSACTTKQTFPFTLGTYNVTLYAGWAIKKGDHYYQVIDSSSHYVQASSGGQNLSTYDVIPSTVSINGTDYTVTSMDECYKNCTNLTGTVHVPPTVTSMTNCFQGTTLPIYVIPHSASSKTAWTTATSSLSNVHVMDEPALDTYHYTTDNVDTVTFGGYDEGKSINKVVSYLDTVIEADAYLNSGDSRLIDVIEQLGWYDIDNELAEEIVTPFYYELADLSTTATVGFREDVSSVNVTVSDFTTWTSPTFEYSYDNNIWSSYTLGNTITLNNTNPRVYFRGDNLTSWYVKETINSTSYNIKIHGFINTSNVKTGGNIMSLRYKNFDNITTIPCDYAFYDLFYNQTYLITAPILPATTLTNYCYAWMFQNTHITTAPSLPATKLATYCYYGMFDGCVSLISAPILPATTLADYCYYRMFRSCASLVEAPALPANSLASFCYYYMFYNCTALTKAPILSATVLNTSCYAYMFYGCTALVNAPSLPATTLVTGCYQRMFYGCTSLIIAPILPATFLPNTCYAYMFYNCTSLTTPPQLPATTLATYCYQRMFYGCTALTSIPALPATTLMDSCYLSMFENSSITAATSSSSPNTYEYRIPSSGTGTTNYTNSMTTMFTDYTPTINTTFYVSVPTLE